ncbi:MAG: DUF2851 family protein [Cyclobacteriaceae bacterium]
MKEDLLHYLWKYQAFDKTDLQTSDQQPINVINPGSLNTNAGPDFTQAQIMINDIMWFGAVEIHINSADWHRHKHQEDSAYEQVILHVVWQHSKDIRRQDGSVIPTLSLSERISPLLLKKIELLQRSSHGPTPACAPLASQVTEITKLSALERAAATRLQRKSNELMLQCQQQQMNWSEIAYQWLCRSFGFKVNAAAFFEMSKDLPYNVVLKHRDSLQQLCALLLGTAGLIEFTREEVQPKLQQEYEHLQRKFSLPTLPAKYGIKRGRLRPANLPERRLLQLAALLHVEADLWNLMVYTSDLPAILAVFEKAQQALASLKIFKQSGKIGQESVYNLIINAFVTLRYAYGSWSERPECNESALALLQQLPGEKNHVTRLFDPLGFPLKSALESQGVLELHAYQCQMAACLQCPVGVSIVRK